jgi:hypothetical protein
VSAAGELGGMRIVTFDLVPDDTILLVADMPWDLRVKEFLTEKRETPEADPYAVNFSDWCIRMSLSVTYEPAPVRYRPSWLHPFRRVLWVHRNGPHIAEIVPKGRYCRVVRRPPWLHPIRRVLWVHVHGPRIPEVKVIGGSHPSTPLSMSVIQGVTL